MALDFDMTRAVRSRDAQCGLLRAIVEAPPTEQETHWLEWKGRHDLVSLHARATIAKGVLGFANRLPSKAAQQFEGTGYLVIGAEPGGALGVEPVDIAKLEAGVRIYTGGGPTWRADYVDIDGVQVLLVTVEAPGAGDVIFATHKAFHPHEPTGLKFDMGAIFVRRAASTEPASAQEIEQLSRRAVPDAVPHQHSIDARVSRVNGRSLRRLRLDDDALSEAVERKRSELLAPLEQVGAPGTLDLMRVRSDRPPIGEHRSRAEYEAEVDSYLLKYRDGLVERIRARSVACGVGRLDLRVENPTDTNFEKVRIDMRVPSGVGVVVNEEQAERDARDPVPPRPWGEKRGIGAQLTGALFEPPVVHAAWKPFIEYEPRRVCFTLSNLRPDGHERLDPIWLVLDLVTGDELTFEWEATATNAAGRCRGQITVSLAEEAMSACDLLVWTAGTGA